MKKYYQIIKAKTPEQLVIDEKYSTVFEYGVPIPGILIQARLYNTHSLIMTTDNKVKWNTLRVEEEKWNWITDVINSYVFTNFEDTAFFDDLDFAKTSLLAIISEITNTTEYKNELKKQKELFARAQRLGRLSKHFRIYSPEYFI